MNEEITKPVHTPTLFLDMDGVMLPGDYVVKQKLDETVYNRHKFDPACLAVLNQILERCKPELVISSTWRTFIELPAMRKLFEQQGMLYPISGYTPYLTDGNGKHMIRGEEIAEWLKMNPKDRAVCILDDDDDMGMLGQYLIKTSYMTGLLPEHVDPVCKLLLS